MSWNGNFKDNRSNCNMRISLISVKRDHVDGFGFLLFDDGAFLLLASCYFTNKNYILYILTTHSNASAFVPELV